MNLLLGVSIIIAFLCLTACTGSSSDDTPAFKKYSLDFDTPTNPAPPPENTHRQNQCQRKTGIPCLEFRVPDSALRTSLTPAG
jgi:hypothetical protein